MAAMILHVTVVPWLLNVYGGCTIRELMMYFEGEGTSINPRMVQTIHIKKPWYSWLVSTVVSVA